MRNHLVTSSIEAMMAAGANSLAGLSRETAKDHVELRLLYNPFEPEAVEIHELEYREGATLSEYIGELPEEAEWMVFFNGEEVEDLSTASEIQVKKGDRIGVLMIPQGSSVKSILRIVLTAGAIALAFTGIGFWAALAINIGVGLVSAFLLTPKPPKANSDDDGRSYGIDGAKNSATEGIPYPVVYGQFRCAGNFADCFTVNSGDNQYLYTRTVLNDGEVESITDIEINEQPVKNFKDIQTQVALGTLTQASNGWFGRSITQVNKSMQLGTGWTTHTTSKEVDQIRFDVTFPSGLVDIDKKKGKHRGKAVELEFQYRLLDPVTKQPIGSWTPGTSATRSELKAVEDAMYQTVHGLQKVFIGVTAPTKYINGQQYSPRIQYRKVGSSTWIDVGSIPANNSDQGYVYDEEALQGLSPFIPKTSHLYEIDLPDDGEYEFRTVDGAEMKELSGYPSAGSGRVIFSDSRTRQIRRSVETTRLTRGYYEVAIRRTTAQSTDQYIIDECWLTDVAEITSEPTNLRGTANLSLRIRLNEQLSNIPTVTALVKGSKVRHYDIDGNVTETKWTDNPAWIALDILCGEERGAQIPTWRIDWPRWLEFAQYCEDNNVKFNGVFDTGSNIGDALMEVCRVGHAMPVPFGTKISVAIDHRRDPVMLFNSANIIQGTFEMGYLPLNDRANEYELSFFDKNDRNKQKTIRYVDPKAVTFNEMPRRASVTMRGIDNVDQARRELWRMIYANRLIIRTVKFDAWLDSIGMNMGDVALIQHSMMEWAHDGKLQGGNTTSITLDKKVTMEPGHTHSVLVHFDAISRGTAQVSSIVGNKILVPTNSLSNPNAPRVTRVVTEGNGKDYQVVEIVKGATLDTITVDRSVTSVAAGSAVRYYDTDVVVERDVSSVSEVGGVSVVNLSSALPAAPPALANFVFGKKVQVKKPYVLTGVSGNGFERRTLTFAEYHEGVYLPPELEIPIQVTRVSDRNVQHVRSLAVDYEALAEPGRRILNARVHWASGHIINYGGADVYMALNGGPFRVLASAVDVSEYHVQLSPNDSVQFKVVAFNKRGDRAPEISAPLIEGDAGVEYAPLDEPRGFTATEIAFEVDGTVQFSWQAPEDPTGVEQYEIQYRHSSNTNWINVGTFKTAPVNFSGIPTGSWVARIRSSSATSVSNWVENPFTVVVTDGSLLANFNASNDRDASSIPPPTLPQAHAVEHTLNTDGSANISLEWIWGGSEATIDGFRIKVTEVDGA